MMKVGPIPTGYLFMRRREFLQKTGLVVAAGSGGLAIPASRAAAQQEQNQRDKPSGDHRRGVLVTSADSTLARFLAGALASQFHVRLTGPVRGAAEVDFVASRLEADEATRAAVRGMEAIVHVAEPPAGSDHDAAIDHRTRGTYNLLRAAVAEGVGQVVYLSSLATMLGYDEQYEVTETWRPTPMAAPDGLSHYLGERTCREFAHSGKLNAAVLRLGTVVDAGATTGKPLGPLGIDRRDVARAVSLALGCLFDKHADRPGWWSVFHVQADSPRARFSIAKARRVLGFQPQVNG
jgi:nucleoside-diphosphate-sugar epimerase